MKKAVILFNLGGPDSLSAVEPFLFNLGHGLLPETNPDTLQTVIERVNNFK